MQRVEKGAEGVSVRIAAGNEGMYLDRFDDGEGLALMRGQVIRVDRTNTPMDIAKSDGRLEYGDWDPTPVTDWRDSLRTQIANDNDPAYQFAALADRMRPQGLSSEEKVAVIEVLRLSDAERGDMLEREAAALGFSLTKPVPEGKETLDEKGRVVVGDVPLPKPVIKPPNPDGTVAKTEAKK